MRAARIDANQPAIVEYFRDRGASVQILSSVGKGCPDLMIGYRSATVPVEIKDGAKPPSERELTPAQELWKAAWAGSFRVVYCEDDAEELLRDIERWTECLPEYAT